MVILLITPIIVLSSCYSENNSNLFPGYEDETFPHSSYPSELTVYKNKLFLRAYDEEYKSELFVYDGMNPPEKIYLGESMWGVNPDGFIIYNDKLMFGGHSSSKNRLWSIDGVNEPEAIFPVEMNASISNVENTTEFKGKIYFSSEVYWDGSELWCYDEKNGIRKVFEINDTYTYFDISMVVYRNKLYFAINNSAIGNELWVYDGNDDSVPTLVHDFDKECSGYPIDFKVYNNKLYFSARTLDHGRELWVYNGTGDPQMVADLNPGSEGSDAKGMTVYRGALYFIADDGIHGRELWRYEGTNAPQMVADLNSGDGNSLNYNQEVYTYTHLFEYNRKLYFQANDGVHGNELWCYDGSNDSLQMVSDINKNGDSNPDCFAVFQNRLYFRAYTDANGIELWEFNGTNNPRLVHDIRPERYEYGEDPWSL